MINNSETFDQAHNNYGQYVLVRATKSYGVMMTQVPWTNTRDLGWPDYQEVDWAVSGAVFGLMTALMQMLLRSMMDSTNQEIEQVDRNDNTVVWGEFKDIGWNRKKNLFGDNYHQYWGNANNKRNPMISHVRKLKKRNEKMNRKTKKYFHNYSNKWNYAPLVIMDEEVEKNEKDVLRNYLNQYKPSKLQKPLKYDLKKLNDDLPESTTTSPWDNLMHKTEYLPSSFSGNILSNFSKKNKKQSVDLKHEEESPDSKYIETERVGKIDKNIKKGLMNKKTKYKYKPINSYVSYILIFIFI